MVTDNDLVKGSVMVSVIVLSKVLLWVRLSQLLFCHDSLYGSYQDFNSSLVMGPAMGWMGIGYSPIRGQTCKHVNCSTGFCIILP